MSKWENWGDAHPLECGGIWIKFDEEDEWSYDVIRWEPLEEGGGVYDDGYVDLTYDDWPMKDIAESWDLRPEDPTERYVIAIFEYYGGYQLGGNSCFMERKQFIRWMAEKGVEVK